MGVSNFLFACLISALPGPPGVRIEDAYVQLFPISKHKCHEIDPIRDIEFELFTRHNPLMAQNLIIGDDKLLSESHFNFSEPTVLYFHAFFESSQATSAILMRTAYLQRGNYNIILLNAPRLEAGPWYLTASKNTMIVGQYTAKLIDYLVSRGMYLPSLHLIGLSLGAQMAGVCGANVKSGRILRITGLDPAGPLFKKWPKSLKLDRGDAEFVDVIHTDAGIFGYPRQIGHVDFWPNGGISPQPGCTIPEVKRRSPDSIIEPFFCSHWRSYQFYTESVINPEGFIAEPCDHWDNYVTENCSIDQPPVYMGYNLDYNNQVESKEILRISNNKATSNLDFSLPTVIFFHGYIEHSQSNDSLEMRNAYLRRGGHNIIIANMEQLLSGPLYSVAVRNVFIIAKYAAEFIDQLVDKGLDLSKLHLIGMSLGAQIVGNIGSNIKSGKISRITGLDPAGPLFLKLSEKYRLDKNDAEFVDIIHSDAGGFGYPKGSGHADFWPNGGISTQPGCQPPQVSNRNIDSFLGNVREQVFCNHWRSYQYYVGSVNNETLFPAKKCDNWNNYLNNKCDANEEENMGFAVSRRARGNYYLQTTFPY